MENRTKNDLEDTTRATKTLTMYFAIIVGLTAMLHGTFEILQGNEMIKNSFIDAIGSNQQLWKYGNLHAVSYAPTYLIAGCLAIFMGILIIIWVFALSQKKYSSIILFTLILLTFLVGGGYGAPISLGMIAVLASLRTNKPIFYLNDHLSHSVKNVFKKLWPSSLIVFIIVFVVSVSINIIGWPLVQLIGPELTNNFVWLLAIIMICLMVFTLINALIYDAISQS